MEIKNEYYSQVNEAGEMQPSTMTKLLRETKLFAGKRIHIVVQRYKPTRSNQQNRYLHLLFGIFKDALNELGNELSMQKVKDICKFKFLLIDEVNEDTGEVIGQRIKGTSECSKVEMMLFVEQVIHYAAEKYNIKLPYPNEEFEIDFDKSDKMFNQFR